MAAASLPIAATEAFDNLRTLWLADTLKAKLIAFCQAILPVFPQSEVNSHPVSNWATLIYALATEMPATNVPYEGLATAADQVYRICWMANQLGNVQSLITPTQTTFVLTTYNAQFT